MGLSPPSINRPRHFFLLTRGLYSGNQPYLERTLKKFLLVLLVSYLWITPGFSVTSSSSGFFSLAWKEGKAWFLDPSGKPFLSLGVNAIEDGSYRAPNDLYYN